MQTSFTLKDLAMEGYNNLQIETYSLILKGLNNFKKSPKERTTVSYVQTRLENLEVQWQSFYDTHRKLICEVSKEILIASEYYKKKVYESAEENYMDYKSLLKEKLSTLNEQSCQSQLKGTDESNSGASNNFFAVRLPKISIPIFSGKYTEWNSFRDLFISLIDKNRCLDDVQKLHYLKGHLSGEAEQLLRHIPITSNNYNVCWIQLKNRYDNKRFLSNNILKRFMGQRILQFESSSAIKELLDSLNECLHGLQNLGVDVSNWDIIIIYIVSQKLDPESRKQWEAKASSLSEELPTLKNFKEFLEHRFRSLEFLDVNPKSKSNRPSACHVVNSNNVCEANYLTCIFCKGNHKLINCKLFAKENLESRRNFVQTNKLCFNCFGESHPVFFCRDTSRCKFCKRKHHSLLHSQYLAKSTEKAESVDKEVSAHVATTSHHDDQEESQSDPESVVACFSTTVGQGLLPTALVRAELSNGSNVTLRCLLDQGSQTSFITESAVQALGLQKVPANIDVSGIGDSKSGRLNSRSMVVVRLRSIHDPLFIGEVKAYVLNKVTAHLPSRKVNLPAWLELGELQLADPKFNVPNKIDLLLGSKWYSKILKEGLIRDPSGLIIAQDTKLGWILSGEECSEFKNDSETRCNAIIDLHAQVNENELLRKFWEMESEPSVNTGIKMLTEEEQRCEDIFSSTTIRDESGRYIVRLPFRDDDPSCKYGNSKVIAAKRLHLLERRLAKNHDLKENYTNVINEYINLEHMELIPEHDKEKSDAVYLPHHAVLREDKTTTKIRVVFDASCQGTNGVSLNQNLMVGPTLQSDLRHLVMRWRLHPVCIVADIVKMYRQVKVNQDDADFQRILWHDDEGRLQHYRMLRVTFGTASAPYLAVRALQQLARDEGEDLKMASERVLRDFYIDDLMTGCHTVEEGLNIYREMNELLEKGGFELQKWNSNNKEFLDNAISGKINQEEEKLEIGTRNAKEGVMKVLGLSWDKSCDKFVYSVRLPPLTTPVTKRKVVSDISRLFDPLGWIAPVIINAKIFIQKIWLSGIDWDQELPFNLLREWLVFRNELLELNGFSIPRWINTNRDNKLLELHGFSDASNNAYAGVVYARVISNNEDIHVSLVASKTKVSPIKQVSIPRLELCGAMLLSKLLHEVAETLSVPKSHVYAWTDSSVVLAWLSSHPSRWKPFVANRVTEIITLFDRNQWSHVRSGDNPADCASRGVHPSELKNIKLWMEGPPWLRDQRSIGAQCGVEQNSWDTDLEQRAKFSCMVNVSEENPFISRFSSLRKLIRIIAWCRRFFAKGFESKPNWLTTKELQESLSIAVKGCQEYHFNNDPTDKRGKFASLNPYKDVNGIWRVGGRLQNANMSQTQKHPILIPRCSHLAKLIVADAHERTLHGGPQLMINYIRSKFWIIDIKNMVKSYVHKCVVCIRYASKANNPIMGQLPTSRVTASRPFSHSGVDYAGPIAVRTTKGRGHRSTKGYICLFVCMATRAVHLEAVSDLTSEAFLAAFKRFVARRGQCADLWSDNATTFIGADRELKALFAFEKSSVAIEIADWLGNNGTTWHRIPPYSPNFGGLWEAGIKSTKYHLKRVVGLSTLTFEELTTMLAQIEACLNSRPLSRITDNTDDPSPLTPGHFLIGEPLVLVPDLNYESSSISQLRRWQLTQRMVQDFWRRWSHEYLTQFLHRYKWKSHTPEPKMGDIVLVKEDDLPPARWLYGIITDKHPGLDQVTRVVTLRCKGALIKRPISKLCVLPVTE